MHLETHQKSKNWYLFLNDFTFLQISPDMIQIPKFIPKSAKLFALWITEDLDMTVLKYTATEKIISPK